MPVVDVHAHVTPECFKEAISTKGVWHGLGPKAGRLGLEGFTTSVSDRLADMDSVGVDMQVVTPTVGFYQYGNELENTVLIARDCNDEIAEMVDRYPDRFVGMGTVPMQDVSAAIDELKRAMGDLRLKGVMISDHVNGRMYDEPEFLPFFKAAEALGAIVFFHQGGDTLVNDRIRRYKLPNAIGNLTERALVFAALVFGGVMDQCPELKPMLAHGGGFAPYGAARMDKISGAMEGRDPSGGLVPPFPVDGDNRIDLTRAPSTYLSQFYYDCCTYSGPVLRFLIDAVGVDRVMLGTDYPAPMLLKDAVNWVKGLDCLSEDEKQSILVTNASRLLEI